LNEKNIWQSWRHRVSIVSPAHNKFFGLCADFQRLFHLPLKATFFSFSRYLEPSGVVVNCQNLLLS
jgi:hypothetical protein